MNTTQFATIGEAADSTHPEGPLLSPFRGPFGGVPPFDRIKVADFEPAIATAMQWHREELERIVSNPDKPTFENTIAALEDAGRAYRRAVTMMWTYTGTMSDAPMQEVEKALAPRLSAHEDEVVQNEPLFARIRAVWEARASAGLVPEQARLLEVVYLNFTRNGANLGAADKARLKEINGKLASLYTAFSQNQLADEEEQSVVLESEGDLVGLPKTLIAGAKASADAKGLSGKWLIANTRSAVEPFLVYSQRRDLREKVWRMFVSRGDSPGAHDNKPVIREILALRAERARLLGFPSHAHWKLDYSMAKTPDAALALMMKVWPAASARAREEIASMQQLADAEGAGHPIAPWDTRHYSEKVRRAKYDFNGDAVKDYLQLDQICAAIFWVAGQIFDLTFREVQGVPVYHPDVRAFEVTRGGERVGLFYFDPYARKGKRSGAWMSEYRTQEAFKDAITPIVSNNSNYVKSEAGQPVLISWGDASTVFHEFGHALHGLLSRIKYPTLAGTNTLGDFVEFPSQLLEHWLLTPEVLKRFAVHYKTSEPIPPELVAKIQAARNFNQGFQTVEYLLCAIYDMRIHMLTGGDIPDPVEFEKATIAELKAPTEIAFRHRPPQFGHIFSGESYSAGYYSYLWADALTADAAEAFSHGPGFYDKDLTTRLETAIFAVGNTIPPEEAFRRFRGRDVDTEALMRDRGLR